MANLAAGQLSKHPTKGYRISCGWYLKNGKKTPKVFWLGHDKQIALLNAAKFRWANPLASAMGGWTKEYEQMIRSQDTMEIVQHRFFEAEKVRQQLTPHLAAPVVVNLPTNSVHHPAPPTTPTTSGKTLYQAIDAYLESLKAKRKAESHKWRAEQVLRVNLKKARPDCPLASIDYTWLDSLADYFKARPLSLRGKGDSRKAISPQTVKVILQYLRQFFIWLDDSSFDGWEGPRKLTKPFRVQLDDLRSPAEMKVSRQIRQFDLSTLVQLYRSASAFQKQIMLTALFTGATQQELAVMEKTEFDLGAATLHHFRNKTRIEGKFWLPKELVDLLQVSFAEHKHMPLAFYTSAGGPLVSYKNGRLASDAVRQSWDDLRIKAKLPDAFPFKYLRKFLADWITRHGGQEMGQLALSHKPTTILSKHYTDSKDFDRLHGLQREMYAELKAAGMFEASKLGKSPEKPVSPVVA